VLFLDTHLQTGFSTIAHEVFTEVNGDHGRIGTRKVWICSEVNFLIENHPRWKIIRAIAMIESTREGGGE
jgi:hypothetical protein